MLEALRHYFTEDYKARFRHNMICVAIATIVYFLCNEVKYPEAFAMQTGIGVLVICFVVSVLLYMFRHRNDTFIAAAASVRPNVPYSSPNQMGFQIDPHAAWRRRLLVGVAWVIPLVLIGKGAPTVEGAIVNARLNKYLQGEPSRAKLEGTAQIVSDAAERKLPVSPALVVKAANHFATYQSSLAGLPLTFSELTTLTGTPTDPAGPPIIYGTGCATRPMAGGDSDSGNIFGFAAVKSSNCGDLVIWPTKPEVLHLDKMKSKNVTFVNTLVEYKGGSLTLDNVRFINCTFQVSDAYANNPNVLKLLAAALSGQRINLELST